MSNLPKPSEVDADNIIKPGLDELSDEHRQAYEVRKKQREEAFEALKKKRKEEDLEAYLSSSRRTVKATSLRLETSIFLPSSTNKMQSL